MANAIDKVNTITQANIGILDGIALADIGKIAGAVNEVISYYGLADMDKTFGNTVTEENGIITWNGVSGSVIASKKSDFINPYVEFTSLTPDKGMQIFGFASSNSYNGGGNVGTGLCFTMYGNGGRMQTDRYNGDAGTSLNIIWNDPWETGDVWRIEFTDSTNTIEVFKNGISYVSGSYPYDGGYIKILGQEGTQISNFKFGER